MQQSVAEKLAAFLPPPEAIGSVLEIGCGTGHFTELLANRFPLASIDALDISGPMIDAAKNRIGQCARLRWHTADARLFCPDTKFALIASSSALHWIAPAEVIMKRIAAMLEANGRLVCALMVEGTLGELHGARARLFPHKAAPVRLPCPGGNPWRHPGGRARNRGIPLRSDARNLRFRSAHYFAASTGRALREGPRAAAACSIEPNCLSLPNITTGSLQLPRGG